MKTSSESKWIRSEWHACVFAYYYCIHIIGERNDREEEIKKRMMCSNHYGLVMITMQNRFKLNISVYVFRFKVVGWSVLLPWKTTKVSFLLSLYFSLDQNNKVKKTREMKIFWSSRSRGNTTWTRKNLVFIDI